MGGTGIILNNFQNFPDSFLTITTNQPFSITIPIPLYNKVLVRNIITGVIREGISINRANDLTQYKEWIENALQNVGNYNQYNQSNGWYGVWIEGIGRVETNPSATPTAQWEDLNAPFDRMGELIKVGDTICYAMRSLEVSHMKISKIDSTNCRCTMYGIDVFTGKKTKNGYPKRCIKVK